MNPTTPINQNTSTATPGAPIRGTSGSASASAIDSSVRRNLFGMFPQPPAAPVAPVAPVAPATSAAQAVTA
jgi:hypothetical protein